MTEDIVKSEGIRLDYFQAFELKVLEDVKFLNRFDKKFIIPRNLIADIINSLSDSYRILEINNTREFTYKNIYFDTDNFYSYTTHHNSKGNRYKIRIRNYQDIGQKYLELKFKNNKSKTSKKRIKMNGNDDSEYFASIQKYIVEDIDLYSEKVFINYKRITLLSLNENEKITFDYNIHFSDGTKQKELSSIVVVEQKTSDRYTHSKLDAILTEKKINPGNFSKYCTGCVLLNENLKHNRFKERILELKKMEKEYNGLS